MVNLNSTLQDISFIESLDTVNQDIRFPEEEKIRTEHIFKLSALFSKRIILSDTQIVDNLGIQELFLEDKGFQDLLNEFTLVGMRPKASNFKMLVEQQLKDGMRFSSFEPLIRMQVESRTIENLDKLSSITHNLRYNTFIEKLDCDFLKSNKKHKIEYKSYPELVENNLKEMQNKILHNGARKLSNELMDKANKEWEHTGKKAIDRTIFYSVIDESNYTDEAKGIVKRFFVDRQYNKNFWYTNGFNCLAHSSNKDYNLFRTAFPNLTEEMFLKENGTKSIKNKKFDFSVTPPGLLYLDLIDFHSLCAFRHDFKKTIEGYLDSIQKSEDTESALKNLRDYIQFLVPSINKYYENKKLKDWFSKAVKVTAVGASIIAVAEKISPEMAFGIPYITPENSISIGGLAVGAAFILLIKNLVDVIPNSKQSKICYEFERCLMEETHVY